MTSCVNEFYLCTCPATNMLADKRIGLKVVIYELNQTALLWCTWWLNGAHILRTKYNSKKSKFHAPWRKFLYTSHGVHSLSKQWKNCTMYTHKKCPRVDSRQQKLCLKNCPLVVKGSGEHNPGTTERNISFLVGGFRKHEVYSQSIEDTISELLHCVQLIVWVMVNW